jgi:hypothetical protein
MLRQDGCMASTCCAAGRTPIKVSAPQHKSEQVASWNLSALLERELVEPFDAQYGDLVIGARYRLGSSE